jgi:5-methyltetrahydrofolate--homocysteine methyltransferase
MMLVIGERINSSRKSIAQAIMSRDKSFIQSEVKAQAEAGARYTDVNAAVFLAEQAEYLKWTIEAVREICGLPLCIDCPDANVIRQVLPLAGTDPREARRPGIGTASGRC